MWMIELYIKKEKEKQQEKWAKQKREQKKSPAPKIVKPEMDIFVCKRRLEWLSLLPDSFNAKIAQKQWQCPEARSWSRIKDLKDRGLIAKTSYYEFQKIEDAVAILQQEYSSHLSKREKSSKH